MRRCARIAFLFFLSVVACAAGAEAEPEFPVRVDGRILRKAAEKLVFSLSEFEIRGRGAVRMENRVTGETRTIRLASSYDDISYSEPLPAAEIDAIREADWRVFVDWIIPGDIESLNRRLAEVHEEQNRLRKELGNALLEGGDPAVKVSSRLVLNKIEKYHRIGAWIAGEIARRNAGNADANPFLFPVRVEVGFNPFGSRTEGSRRSPLELAGEVVYWEIHRILTQQFDVRDEVVDLVFRSPATVRRIAPPPGAGEEVAERFVPGVVLTRNAVDAAVYLSRQGTAGEVRRLVRLGLYRDPFLTDRRILDAFVNEGSVVDVTGSRVAVSFVPPFVRPGDALFLRPEGEGGGEIRMVAAEVREDEGYTLTAPLAAEEVSRIRRGAVVHRK